MSAPPHVVDVAVHCTSPAHLFSAWDRDPGMECACMAGGDTDRSADTSQPVAEEHSQ